MINIRAAIEQEVKKLLPGTRHVPHFSPQGKLKSGRRVWRANGSANSIALRQDAAGNTIAIVNSHGEEVTHDNLEKAQGFSEYFFAKWEFYMLQYGREQFAADLQAALRARSIPVLVRCSTNPRYYAASLTVEHLAKDGKSPGIIDFDADSVTGELAAIVNEVASLSAQQNTLKLGLDSVSTRLNALILALTTGANHARTHTAAAIPLSDAADADGADAEPDHRRQPR